MRVTRERQRELDLLTYETYLDHGLSAPRTAHQLGIDARTVTERCNRHVMYIRQLEREKYEAGRE